MSNDPLSPISSTAAARAFLEVCRDNWISALKMQNLVYIAHFNHICVTSQPFISDRLEAWTNGPVFPKLYQLIGYSDKKPANVEKLMRIQIPDNDIVEYAGEIWINLKDQSGMDLSHNACGKSSPWHAARNPPRESLSFFQKLVGWKPKHPIIEDAMIRYYFVMSGVWRPGFC